MVRERTDYTGNIRSWERKFPGTFVSRSESSRELSFQGAKVPTGKERNYRGAKSPDTIRSLDRSFPGTFVLGTLDLSCRGPFVHLSAEHVPSPLTKKEQHNKQKCRPMTAMVHSCYTQRVDQRYNASRLNRFSSSECGLLNDTFSALQPSIHVHYQLFIAMVNMTVFFILFFKLGRVFLLRRSLSVHN